MAKRRANGEGNIRKRKDSRWEGRYTAGRNPATGKAIYKNVLGKTQAEVKEKLKKAIEETKGLNIISGADGGRSAGSNQAALRSGPQRHGTGSPAVYGSGEAAG